MEEAALRNLIRASLSLAFLAAFSLANAADAATILVYGQNATQTEVVTEGVVGGRTFLTSGPLPPQDATPISVSTTSLGILAPPPTGPILSTALINLSSSLVAAPNALSLGGFSGTITLTSATGTPQLTATVQNNSGVLTLNTSGGASFLADVVFTNLNGAIVTQLGGATTAFGAASLSFSNVNGTLLSGFQASNGGTFSTVVPEPTSLISGSIAVLAGVGAFGFRRLRPSKA
jgi:hypothetical protein